MKPLKAYPPTPLQLFAYWPAVRDGKLVALAICGPMFSRVYDSWTQAALDNAAPFQRDAWLIGPDAGHVGNLYALHELLAPVPTADGSGNLGPGFQLRAGVHTDGRGLWSIDLHPLHMWEDLTTHYAEKPSLMLRDAEPIVGAPCPYDPCADATQAVSRALDLLALIYNARDELNRESTPLMSTLGASGACWTRYELVPGGLGNARRVASRNARIDAEVDAANVAGGAEIGIARNDKLALYFDTAEEMREPRGWMSKPSPRRTLKRRDAGATPDGWGWEPRTDEYALPAFYGPRVERWSSDCVRGRLYDIRCAYADAMRYPLPTRFLRMGAGTPPDEGFVIAEASVCVPPSLPVPPLPYRLRGGPFERAVFWPTGAWDGTYTLEELEVARALGATYRVKRWWLWETEQWLAPYVMKWWNARRRATANGGDGSVAKAMLNALYGKFAQRDEFVEVTTDITAFESAITAGLNPRRHLIAVRGQRERAALYYVPVRRVSALRHTAVAACVSARARCELNLALWTLTKQKATIVCANTDSVATDGKLLTGSGLGEWREDMAFDRCEALADQCAAFLIQHQSRNQWDIRAAGLAINRHAGESEPRYIQRVNAAWESLRTKGHADVPVTRSVFNGVASAGPAFAEETRRYAAHTAGSIPKRVDAGFGSTEPWPLAELRRRAAAPA